MEVETSLSSSAQMGRFSINPVGFLMVTVFFLITIQDLVAARLAIGLTNTIPAKFFLFSKELIVFFLAAVVYPKIGSRNEIKIAFLFLTITFLYVLISPLPFSAALQDYRPYVLVATSFMIGNYIGKNIESFKHIINSVFILSLFIVIFSFIEHYLFPETMFRVYFPVVKIATEIKGFSDKEFYIDGLPGNFINSDAGQRMVGPFGDPLYMGYFFIFCLNIIFSYWFLTKRKFNYTLVLILIGIFCIFLSQVRAIWVGLAISLFIVFFTRKNIKYLFVAFILGAVFVMINTDLILPIVRSIFTWDTGSSVNHVLAYVNGIPRILSAPLGSGIGTAGSFAVRLLGDNSSVVGVENAYINLALEIGVIPMICIVLVILYIIRGSRKLLLSSRLNLLTLMERIVLMSGLLLNVQFFIAGLFSPHILTARIVIPFWFLNGVCVYVIRRHSKNTNL